MTSPDPSTSRQSSVPPASQAPTGPGSTLEPQSAGIVGGILLVVIGGVFLVGRVLDLTLGPDAWPLWIVGPGLGLLVASFFVRPPGGLGLAIPGAIIATVGAILWVQATYDLYATWAYAWALTAPTAPGLGMLFYGVVKGDRKIAGDGLRTTLIGLGLFLGFALFFEGVLGLSGERVRGLDEVLPFVAIGLGAVLVVASLVGRRGPDRDGRQA